MLLTLQDVLSIPSSKLADQAQLVLSEIKKRLEEKQDQMSSMETDVSIKIDELIEQLRILY